MSEPAAQALHPSPFTHPPMTPLDSRRQTGAGFLLDGPGAAMEVLVLQPLRDQAADAWRRHARALCDAVGWTDSSLVARQFPRGLSLALSAPVDRLYTATEVNEAAWTRARAEIEGAEAHDLDAEVGRLRRQSSDEADPRLAALVHAAQAHDVPLVWDDDAVTVGLGAGGRTFAPDDLPDPHAFDWAAVSAVPTALVTGTNGKSTTVRMLAGMAQAGGETVGTCSTDAVTVGGELVERGDFSGPLGARAVMRDSRVTMAVLETARGGLLRRGLPVPRVAAAALTNVAADHLGDYGVDTVEDLADAKLVIAKALGPGGVLVAPADEAEAAAGVVRQSRALAERGVTVAWTALDPGTPTPGATGGGGPTGGGPGGLAASVVGGQVARREGDDWRRICPIEEIPAALGGAARHVVRNALTATALAHALGLADDAIAAGLRAFRSDPDDNPGRANRFTVNGATVVIDYAHNPHGLRALADLSTHWDAQRRLVTFSSAGDRSDRDLGLMADVLTTFGAERYLVSDIPGYLRGRQPGEVPSVLAEHYRQRGVPDDAIVTLPDPAAAARWALDWCQPGDLAVLITLDQRDQVLDLVRQAAE